MIDNNCREQGRDVERKPARGVFMLLYIDVSSVQAMRTLSLHLCPMALEWCRRCDQSFLKACSYLKKAFFAEYMSFRVDDATSGRWLRFRADSNLHLDG